ncbi:hypothetical protein Naga_101285g1, partial [Nannochloropsis gaditana]
MDPETRSPSFHDSSSYFLGHPGQPRRKKGAIHVKSTAWTLGQGPPWMRAQTPTVEFRRVSLFLLFLYISLIHAVTPQAFHAPWRPCFTWRSCRLLPGCFSSSSSLFSSSSSSPSHIFSPV